MLKYCIFQSKNTIHYTEKNATGNTVHIFGLCQFILKQNNNFGTITGKQN